MKRSLFDQEVEISEKTQRIWASQLDIWRELDRICRKYDIKYYANGGTLIGCYRHKGFIPYDNDMDFMMLREDFDKFIKVARAGLGPRFRVVSVFLGDETFSGVTRIFDTETTYFMGPKHFDAARRAGHNAGMFIDIFCFDEVPADYTERVDFLTGLTELKKLFIFWYRRMVAITMEGRKDSLDYSNAKAHYYELIGRYIHECTKYRGCGSGIVADTSVLVYDPRATNKSSRIVWLREWLSAPDPELYPFEDVMMPVPIGGRTILDTLYPGWDREYQNTHPYANEFQDPDTPYTEYLEKYNDFYTLKDRERQ